MIWNEKTMSNYFRDKRVLILGSAPCVENVSSEEINEFDVVVRCNNYKFFNESKKINIYYSFFGKSIKKKYEDIKNDKIDFLFFKYPNFNFTKFSDGKNERGIGEDFRWVYEYRKKLIKKMDCFIQTKYNFMSNYLYVGKILTTGVSAIVDVLRYYPRDLYIAGFDFFESKIHNISEKWEEKYGIGHDTKSEKKFIKNLLEKNIIKTSKDWLGL